MKIKLTVNANQVVRSIERYANQLESTTRTFLERLAEIGISSADASFRSASYDGVNDVVVNSTPVWVDERTIAVQASGKAILFIEFGTGVFNPGVHPQANEFGMIRGEYGKGHGKQESWIYVGEPGTNGEVVDSERSVVRTRGNNANRSMYDAAENMRNEIQRIAKEVFGG